MPTLAGQKPACIVNMNKKRFRPFAMLCKNLQEKIEYFSCKAIILYENDRFGLIMIYQPDLLHHAITKKENWEFLKKYGYHFLKNNTEVSIAMLKRRYTNYQDGHAAFPHEVGVFLGYPIEDVQQFIQNKGRNYVICGYWKVYHNADAALKIFQQYHEICDQAMETVHREGSIEKVNYGKTLLK